MYEYHSAFQHVDRIIKKKDGGLPDFWLKLFRDWLLGKIKRPTLLKHCSSSWVLGLWHLFT